MSDDRNTDDGVYRFECEACGVLTEYPHKNCSVTTYDLCCGWDGGSMEQADGGYGDYVRTDDLPAIRAKARTEGARKALEDVRNAMLVEPCYRMVRIVDEMFTATRTPAVVSTPDGDRLHKDVEEFASEELLDAYERGAREEAERWAKRLRCEDIEGVCPKCGCTEWGNAADDFSQRECHNGECGHLRPYPTPAEVEV